MPNASSTNKLLLGLTWFVYSVFPIGASICLWNAVQGATDMHSTPTPSGFATISAVYFGAHDGHLISFLNQSIGPWIPVSFLAATCLSLSFPNTVSECYLNEYSTYDERRYLKASTEFDICAIVCA
jgi:hypothetical protein